MSVRPRSLLPWLATAGRVLLAGVFGYAALSKITDPAATIRAVRAYRLLPDALATGVGHGLPALELVLAVLLLAGTALRLSAAVSTGLLMVFLAGIVSADVRGLRIDCGCFGGGGVTASPTYTREILRDLALLAVAVGLLLLGRSRLALGWGAPQSPAPEPSGASGAERRRHRVAQHRYQVAQVRHRRRMRLLGAGSAALLAFAPVAAIAASAATSPAPVTRVPVGVTPAGGIVVGSSSARHTVIAYEDPQCPVCGEFERVSGPVLAAAVASGKVRVEYRMRSFLGPESVRAVAALGAAQDEGGFERLREALYAHQPQERTGGYTISDLLALGASVGLTDSGYRTAVQEQVYAGWARRVDDQASKDGNTATPQLLLDGRALAPQVVFSPAALGRALAA